MSFYLPNSAVRPTGQEAAEFVDAVPPEYPAVVDPPGTRADTPTAHGANPRLGDEQIDGLAPHGETRATTPGMVLYRADDAEGDFFVIVAGVVEEVEDVDGFLDELGLPAGEALATAIVCQAGSVVVIPVDRLRSVVVRDPVVVDVIMRAYLARGRSPDAP